MLQSAWQIPPKVFPSSATKSRPADRIEAINQRYAAAVKDQPQVTLVET